MSDLFFLPSLRRGLVDRVTAVDPGRGGLGPGKVALGVTVAGVVVDEDVQLLGAHHVASLAPDEIVRRYPVPGAVDVEPNYFPLVELRAPDLPWRYTPARAGTGGRLRPWLALVVVEDGADGIAYTTAGGAVGQLTVAADQAHQLPRPDELWGWAHVQSSRPVAEVAAAVTDEPDALRSRILCPRRLQPGRRYRAALVNAFVAGSDDRSEPAWSLHPAGPVDLVVYDTWTFTTAEAAGDFESLCELLEPASEVGRLGVRAVDVTAPGLDVDWARTPMLVDLVGALADPGVISDDPPPGTGAFTAVVTPILDDVLGRADDVPDAAGYDPLVDDPVVGLPFYGSWPAGATRVPEVGWARDLNLGTTRRMAAGLGARTVRHNQESLMAAAWDQLGHVREAADELNRGRLSAEVGRSWQARLAAVEAGDRLGLAAPLLSFLSVDGTPARRVVADSAAPNALLDRVWMRRAPRARGASAASTFVAATRAGADPVLGRAFGYQAIVAAEGTHPAEVELSTDHDPTVLLSAEALAHVDETGLAVLVGGTALSDFVLGRHPRPRRPRRAGRTAAGGPGIDIDPFPLPPSPGPSTADVAAAVTAMDPLGAMRASLVARIPAFATLLPDGELPAGLGLAPEFTDALFWDLAELDDDVIVPGLGELPNNRVRLLAVNPAFVGAYLVGANHEMARELLWREYPADLTATFFARFFDYGPSATVDIDPIADWPPASAISANLPNAATTTVILVRGDLVRRYPEVNMFISPPGQDGRPDHAAAVPPSFEGRLGADTLVVGFPRSPEQVLGETGDPQGWFVVFEERMVAPRFGLDVARSGLLSTWDELAWTDVDPADQHVGTGPFPDLGTPTLGGVEWGRNAAHLAAAVHQRPFRRAYPATTLVVR